MHYMRYNRDEELWTVGYFEPTDDGGEDWHPIRDFGKEIDAARYVNYLNGGRGWAYSNSPSIKESDDD